MFVIILLNIKNVEFEINRKAIINSSNGIFVLLDIKSLTTLSDAESIGTLINKDTTSKETNKESEPKLISFNFSTRLKLFFYFTSSFWYSVVNDIVQK